MRASQPAQFMSAALERGTQHAIQPRELELRTAAQSLGVSIYVDAAARNAGRAHIGLFAPGGKCRRRLCLAEFENWTDALRWLVPRERP